MTEVRTAVWVGCGAACAAALTLLGGSLLSDDAETTAAGDVAAPDRARARVWPPPRVLELGPALPAPRPAPGPGRREVLRDLWDAEDAAARLVVDRGLDGGLEIPEPPRRAGESAESHRRRTDAMRRHALADALLSHVRMRDFYMSSELPPGGITSRESMRAFKRLPRTGPQERLAALRRATSRMDAAFGPEAVGFEPETPL
jgi:hypothetical protein